MNYIIRAAETTNEYGYIPYDVVYVPTNTVICTVYGGMAVISALTICRELNNKTPAKFSDAETYWPGLGR